MSRRPTDPRIADSPDLKRLFDEGFALEIFEGHLLVHGIPSVTSARSIAHGTLVSAINFAGEVATPPDTHVAYWIGEHPCDANGQKLRKIENSSQRQTLGKTLTVDHTFSAKPVGFPGGRYPTYYEKVTEYVNRISGPAQAIDGSANARTFDVLETREESSVFLYTDTATARAGIGALAERLAVQRIAIVGLGGTGAYVLDHVAKTPAKEIHLFDPDNFLQNNAFRAPGAATIQQLRTKPKKVDYFKSIYDGMRRGVVAHPYAITEETVAELSEMSAVFVCVDSGAARRIVADHLVPLGVPVFDTGLGMVVSGEALIAQTRVSSLIPGDTSAYGRLPFGERSDDDDPYRKNIQTSDLNDLNALLAVIRWKRLCGFYHDQQGETHSIYSVNTNTLANKGAQ